MKTTGCYSYLKKYRLFGNGKKISVYNLLFGKPKEIEDFDNLSLFEL